MIQCYFGKEKELSNKWGVRAMNFGQDRPEENPKVSYKMIIEVNDINDWSKKTMLEIKKDAQNFPGDWGRLGQVLLTREETDFHFLKQIDINLAHEFAVDFAHNILVEVEKKYGYSGHLKPDYVLNAVEDVKLIEQMLIIEGKAFIMGR